MGKRISLARIRREIKKDEIKLAEDAARDFKRFVKTLPLRARLVLAYKIARGIL